MRSAFVSWPTVCDWLGECADRSLRWPDGSEVELRPDRVRCVTWGVTHVVLPAFYVTRRAHLQRGGDRRSPARQHRRPRAPADRYRPGRTGSDPAGIAARRTTGCTSVDLARGRGCRQCGVGEFDPRSPAHTDRPSPAQPARPGSTGIDYLVLLAVQHRRQIEDRLHLADHDGALATLPPWHLLRSPPRPDCSPLVPAADQPSPAPHIHASNQATTCASSPRRASGSPAVTLRRQREHQGDIVNTETATRFNSHDHSCSP